MSKAPHRSLDEILSEAQTLPPQEQLRFVREACGTDAAMYADAVEHMQSRALWSDALDKDLFSEEVAPVDPAGQLIGPYRIVRSLGQGGMGEVFLAERADDQFRQHVAIKLVRRGLLSRQVQGRLRQERQILASLEHTNIARLYDGGTTSDGTPYIVMEYVDGQPIDSYCDARRWTVEQRLRLFLTVCSAVHYAHQNLIVHRDLKPSNILVTPDGVPKLLDFGIAKILDDRQVMHTLAVTHADIRVMTPDHASPEQIRGDIISTASDIYVLGVLLYELLCGYKPFVLRGNRLAELERAICENDPPLLSDAIASAQVLSRSEAAEVAELRSVSVSRLRRELAGDLDNIVMKAMHKEPARRYASVEQFAADVERYLQGMPVTARPDAWSYRAGKFARRHAVVVAFSAALIALLIGFTATTYMQSKRIERERDTAQAERRRAEGERERAEAVSTFLIDSFTLADPSRARGSEITAKEILDRGAAHITTELRKQPALQATLLDTIGSVYLGLGKADEAQPLIERGLSIRRGLFGPTSRDVARSLYSLNRVYERKGDYKTAESLARESLAINRQLSGPESLDTAGSVCRLGVILQEKGELASAEQLFNRCLSIRIKLLGPNHEQLTSPLDNLARIAQDRGDYPESGKLFRRALEIARHAYGEDHPQYVRALYHVATAVYDRGDMRTADVLLHQAIALYQRILGATHPETLDAMSTMGLFLMETGKLDEAEKLLQNVLDTNRKIRPQHAYIGNDLENLGRIALKKKQYAAAENYFLEALTIYRRTLQPGHGLIAVAWTMLGRTRLEQGAAVDAESALKEALAAWSIEYREDYPGYAMANAALGRSLALQGRYPAAERLLITSYPTILKLPQGPDRDEAVRNVQQWIENLYQSMGQPEAARKYFAQMTAAR